MKKRLWGLFLLALLTSFALAGVAEDITTPCEGPAVAAPKELYGTVPLFDTVDDGGTVLMAYCSGAQMEVTRVLGNGMVQVQVGEPGASVMGYMREGDLRYGALAQRKVQRCDWNIGNLVSLPVYAYCDEQAPTIGWTVWDYSYEAIGRNDGRWVQLDDGLVPDMRDRGFLHLPDSVELEPEPAESYSWIVDPLPGELTQEEAYNAALDSLLENPGLYAMQLLPEELRTREGLMSMDAQVRLITNWTSGRTTWDVYLQNGEDYESNVDIQLTPEGELIDAEHGNG